MALVEKFHVVAALYPVDPDTAEIIEGMCVAFNGTAGVRRVDATTGVGQVLGIAGDTKSTSQSGLPGVYSGWQNRVSDMFDETKASGKLTVYHSGGEFATDQFVDSGLDASAVGAFLEADATTGKLKLGTGSGAAKGANTIAQLIRGAGTYPSGVPGIDLNGDMALKGSNSDQYIEFKLLV